MEPRDSEETSSCSNLYRIQKPTQKWHDPASGGEQRATCDHVWYMSLAARAIGRPRGPTKSKKIIALR